MNTATPHTPRYCATIGNFDGIHLGHRQVLLRLKEVAAARGMKTMVVTFDRHPAATACPERVPLQLMTLDEKVATLKALGIDRVEVLTFDRDMMLLPAFRFMQDILRDQFSVAVLLTGYDNHFGRRNAGEDFHTYQSYGARLGIDVVEGPRPEECGLFEGTPISSSLVRRLLKEGRTEAARHLLARD